MNNKIKVSINMMQVWTTGDEVRREQTTLAAYGNTKELAEIAASKIIDTHIVHTPEYQCYILSVQHNYVKMINTFEGERRLSKDELFDFISTNEVQLEIDSTAWINTNGDEVLKKYNVTINNKYMNGFDLEDAINQYLLEN